MTFNLLILNVWIGMCKGVKGLPLCFHNMGFTPQWIEGRFANSEHKPVNPDLIIASSAKGHTMVMEWKEGANTEADQLNRYAAIKGTDLANQAFIEKMATKTHDIVVICKAEWRERIRIGIEGRFPFMLLIVEEAGLSRDLNHSRCQAVNQEFSPFLKIDWDIVPTSFVPMNRDSELWEIAELAAPLLIKHLIRRTPRVEIDEICRNLCPEWGITGNNERSQIRSRVRDVLSRAAQHHFRPYLSITSKHIVFRDVLNTPLRNRRSALRKLRKFQADFIEYLRTGRDPVPQLPISFEENGTEID